MARAQSGFAGGERAARFLSGAFRLLLVLAALSLPAYAVKIHPDAGSTSAAFLKLGVGARAAALGGAFAAVPGDPFAIYWNPAGLAYAGPGKSVGFFHNEYFQGLGQEFLSYSAPAKNGGWGLGLNYFYAGDGLERRSGLNEADAANPISPPEGEFGAYDLAFSAGYARRYAGDYALGAAFKVIRQSVDDESGASAALDLGLLREFSWRGGAYTAGLSVQNLGPGIKFVERRYALPLIVRAGLSRRLEESGALLTLEADKPSDNYPSVAVGAEYPLTGRLSLRSGYRYRQHGNELGAWSGFSAGAGVAFDRLTLDYAFSPFGVLGNSHRFSLHLRFGEPRREARAAVLAAQPGAPGHFVFQVSPRALTLSSRGTKYEIRAVSDACGLSALRYKTMLRGEAPADLAVVEGAVTGELLAGFPAGVLPLKAWRPGALPGTVQGDIAFVFRVPKAAAGAGAAAFFYRDGAQWREVPALPAGEDGENLLFSASAPLSSDYALGLKVGN